MTGLKGRDPEGILKGRQKCDQEKEKQHCGVLIEPSKLIGTGD